MHISPLCKIIYENVTFLHLNYAQLLVIYFSCYCVIIYITLCTFYFSITFVFFLLTKIVSFRTQHGSKFYDTWAGLTVMDANEGIINVKFNEDVNIR